VPSRPMKNIFIIILFTTFSFNSFSQEKSFRPTYVYEGFIKTEKGEKLKINLNFLVLLDSTLVGSYYYYPRNGSLGLVGHLNSNLTFSLVERDKNDIITGEFKGRLTSDKKTAFGKWVSPSNNRTLTFEIELVKNKSYWDFIRKNRALYEYNDLSVAINKSDKVLSIDVASQGITNLPGKITKLKKIVSFNLLGNKFSSFPEQLGQLTSLDEISLSSNRIENVGPEIGNLKNLRILIMNNNQLKSLPKELGKLTNLLYLELGNNKLTHLPEEIKYLSKLQELHIERNKLTDLEKKRIKKALPNCVIHF
jgi:Leucine-rich repeat (LRR) protein